MKKKLEVNNALTPVLTIIVGAMVDGKPNFVTIAWNGVIEKDMVFVAIAKGHHTTKGILLEKKFSINIPGEDLIEATDYIGINSGKKIEKSILFKIFYGEMKNVPMIEEAKVTMECTVVEKLEYGTHFIFIGKVTGNYADESVLDNDKVNIGRIKPLFYDTHQKSYWGLGQKIGQCWFIGKDFNKND